MDGNQRKLITIYLCVWLVAIIMTSLGIYDMDIPSVFSRNLILLHLVGFTLGTVLIRTKTSVVSRQGVSSKNIEIQIEKFLKSPLFRILLIIMTLYATYLFGRYWAKVTYYNSISETRDQFLDIYGALYYNFTKSLLFLPMSIICYILFGYAVFRKRDWVCLLMGYFLLVNASLMGGRFGYVYILLGIIFVNIFIIKESATKYIVGMVGLVLGALVLIVIVTAFRHGIVSLDKENLEIGMDVAGEQLVTYVTGSQIAFDYAIDNHYLSIAGGYGKGIFTFSPIINFVNLFTSTLAGIDIAPGFMKFVNYLEENQIFIGGFMGWNALYTSVLFYYIDGGVIGVFIFPLFIGLFFSLVYKQMLRKGSVLLYALVLYFFICIVKGVFKFEIVYAYDTFVLLLMYFLGTRKIKFYGNK